MKKRENALTAKDSAYKKDKAELAEQRKQINKYRADLDAKSAHMDKVITEKANTAGNAKYKDFTAKWGAWVYILSSNCVILLVLLAMITNAGQQIGNLFIGMMDWFTDVPALGGLDGVDKFNFGFWYVMRIVAGLIILIGFILICVEMDRITFTVGLILADLGVFGALYYDSAIKVVLALFAVFITVRTYLGCKVQPDTYNDESVWEFKTGCKPFPNVK